MTLQNTDDAKVILANAARHLTQSVKIWLAAADLETDPKAKRKVLRTGESNDIIA
jgi:pre-mRNA-processing factor 6